MRTPWRPLAFAAAFNAAAGVAAAQTVIATNAPAGSTVEFVLNDTTVGSAAADAAGTATIASRAAQGAKPEMDANLYVDVCDAVRRVLVVDRSLPPAAPGVGCVRNQISGIFLVRPVSTLVVDVGASNPTVLLRQGRYTLRRPGPARSWTASHRGLVIYAGGGLTKFSDMTALACGNVLECSADGSPLGYTAGVAYWFTPYVAARADYLKPGEGSATGTEGINRFTSTLDAHVFTFGGSVGVPVKRARLYGNVGATYHNATFDTTQTIEGATPGTQTYELETAGWGWSFGGGFEIWLGSRFAIYTEGGRSFLKGDALDDADGSLDEGLTSLMAGVRFRIGR